MSITNTVANTSESVALDPTVDASSPFEQRALQAIAHIRAAMKLLNIPASVKTTTARQRQHGLKFRKGAEPPMRTIATLAELHGIRVPAHPPARMLETLDEAQTLELVQMKLAGALGVVNAAALHGRATSYASALTLYGILKKVGHRDGELRSGLASVEAFFSYRHRPTPNQVAAAAKAEKSPVDATTPHRE